MTSKKHEEHWAKVSEKVTELCILLDDNPELTRRWSIESIEDNVHLEIDPRDGGRPRIIEPRTRKIEILLQEM